MFKTLGKLASGTARVACKVAGAGARGGITLAGEVIAGSAEMVAGKNGFSDGVRVVKEGLNKATDGVVKVAAPVAGAIAGAPFRKAEHVKDLVVGGVQTALGDEEKGKAKMKKAAVGVAVTVATLGVLDEDTMEMAGAAVEAVRDSLGDAMETVAGALGGAGEAVAGLLGGAGEAVADAGAGSVVDLGDVLAGTGPDAFAGVDGVGLQAVEAPLAAAPPPPPAHGSVLSHAAEVRFQGRTPVQVLMDLAEPQRVEFMQAVIDEYPDGAPRGVLTLLGTVKRGAWSMAGQALTEVAPHVNLTRVAARVLFSGNP